MSESSKSSGVGFGGLLLIAFVVLKLTGFIEWSWWWVLSPAWVPVALAGTLLLTAVLAAAFSGGRRI